MLEYGLFLAATLFGYTMNAITGFAGNIFAMPVGMHTIGLHSSTAALNIVGVFACTTIALTELHNVVWKEAAKMTIGMLIFMFVGIWIGSIADLSILEIVFGIFVLGVGIKETITANKEQKPLPSWALFLVIVGAGLIQGLFVCGGALLVIYAKQKVPDKDPFRGTISVVWVVLNSVYTGVSAVNGYFTPEVIQFSIIAVALSFVATYIGRRIVAHVSQQAFNKLTSILLIIIGISLLVF